MVDLRLLALWTTENHEMGIIIKILGIYLLGECDNSAIHHIFVVMGVCDRLKCSSNGYNRLLKSLLDLCM